MTNSNGGQDWMKQDLGGLIDQLDLGDAQKRYLRSRWLDQVLWMEGKAGRTQIRYYALRITAIVGGVIVPALVGLNFSGTYDQFARGAAFILGLMVAISVAVEEFFHYGERWRHYRSTVETLKSEGWQFFQLSGRYVQYETHAESYREFANQVEQILNAEVLKFITEIVVEKPKAELPPHPSEDGSDVEPEDPVDPEVDAEPDDFSESGDGTDVDADAESFDADAESDTFSESETGPDVEADPDAEAEPDADAGDETLPSK